MPIINKPKVHLNLTQFYCWIHYVLVYVQTTTVYNDFAPEKFLFAILVCASTLSIVSFKASFFVWSQYQIFKRCYVTMDWAKSVYEFTGPDVSITLLLSNFPQHNIDGWFNSIPFHNWLFVIQLFNPQA